MERCPLQLSLVRVASSLDPQKMMQSSSTAFLRFKKLADNLCTLNKISSKIVDNAKFEYDSLQSIAIKKHSEVFLNYDPRKERLKVFLGKYVRPEFENFWHICKLVFSFFCMIKALSNADVQLTSWPLMATCRRSQLCHNSLFRIVWNKRSVQSVNLPYLGIFAKVVCCLHRDTKVI